VDTTTYYYTVYSDGHVEQWSDAAKTTKYDDFGPDFNQIWDALNPIITELSTMSLEQILDLLLIDPDRPAREEEKRKVERAVREMMDDNWLQWIPYPQDRESGPASNDMTTFPDNMSVAGTFDKEWDPVEGDPAQYQAGLDKDGYVLYGHDRTADGAQDDLVSYIDVTTTTYYYTVWSDGHVEQWSDANKSTRYDDGGPDFNKMWEDIVPVLGDLSTLTLAEALDYFLVDPDRPAREAEKRKVQDAVRAMMDDNWLEWIPNPQDRESGPASNDMTTFPDNESEAGEWDKWWEPVEVEPGEYTELDKDGYLLRGHDKTVDGGTGVLEDYIDVDTTVYYYTVWSDGFVEQWSDADKTTRYDDGGPDFNAIWGSITPVLTDLTGVSLEEFVTYLLNEAGINLNMIWLDGIAPVLSDLSTLTLLEALDYLSSDPEATARRAEKRKVEQANREMIEDNYLGWIPYPQGWDSGPATNDMTSFPDNTSEAGTDDKRWEPPEGDPWEPVEDDPEEYTAGDKDGYVLYGHDKTADGFITGLVNYIDVTTTTYYYTAWSNGQVQQFSDAAKTIEYNDGDFDFNLIWADIVPLLDNMSEMSSAHEAVLYLQDVTEMKPEIMVNIWLFTEIFTEITGLDFDESWPEMTPHFEAISDMTLQQAIVYLDTEMGWGLDQLWTDNQSVLADLSLLDRVAAIAYLDTELGIDLTTIWADAINPVIADLSALSVGEAIVYGAQHLPIDPLEYWARITPVLTDLSTKTVSQAVIYGAQQYLPVDPLEYWADIQAELVTLSGMTLAEALEYLESATGPVILDYLGATGPVIFNDLIDAVAEDAFDAVEFAIDTLFDSATGEGSLSLLPIDFAGATGPVIIPDISLMYEIDDVAQVEDALDDVFTFFSPFLLDYDTSINGAPSERLEGIPANGSVEGTELKVYSLESGWGEAAPTIYMTIFAVGYTDYLIICNTEEAMVETINAHYGLIPSLDNTEEYQGIISSLPTELVGLGYLNLSEWLNTVIDIVASNASNLAEQQNIEATFRVFIPSKSALAFSSAIPSTDAMTISFAAYLLPPSLVEHEIPTGTTGTVVIPEQEADFSQFDPDVGEIAVSIDVDVIDTPEGGSIEITALLELPEDTVSGFELAATDAGLTIVDVAYGISVDHGTLPDDNIGTATITMKVDRMWADDYGVDNVRIIRVSNGTNEVLPTVFVGYDGNFAVFEGTSANGLSEFGLVAIEGTNFTLSGLSVTPDAVLSR
jgi:hypothetical protein